MGAFDVVEQTSGKVNIDLWLFCNVKTTVFVTVSYLKLPVRFVPSPTWPSKRDMRDSSGLQPEERPLHVPCSPTPRWTHRREALSGSCSSQATVTARLHGNHPATSSPITRLSRPLAPSREECSKKCPCGHVTQPARADEKWPC